MAYAARSGDRGSGSEDRRISRTRRTAPPSRSVRRRQTAGARRGRVIYSHPMRFTISRGVDRRVVPESCRTPSKNGCKLLKTNDFTLPTPGAAPVRRPDSAGRTRGAPSRAANPARPIAGPVPDPSGAAADRAGSEPVVRPARGRDGRATARLPYPVRRTCAAPRPAAVRRPRRRCGVTIGVLAAVLATGCGQPTSSGAHARVEHYADWILKQTAR